MEKKHYDILLVEDNPVDAEHTIRALNKYNLGNNLIHLKDGAEAIDFIFAKGIYSNGVVENELKVILLDLKMPKVDGLEVLKQIKSDEKTRSIPVIVMTSSKEEQDIVSYYQHGASSYVVKPIDFDQFAKAAAELGLYWLLINRPSK